MEEEKKEFRNRIRIRFHIMWLIFRGRSFDALLQMAKYGGVYVILEKPKNDDNNLKAIRFHFDMPEDVKE